MSQPSDHQTKNGCPKLHCYRHPISWNRVKHLGPSNCCYDQHLPTKENAETLWMPLAIATLTTETLWRVDTGAGALGRHGSEVLGRHNSGELNSSEDGALGSGEEQQNREPDLSKPGCGCKHHFLEWGTLYDGRVPKNGSTGDLSGVQDEAWAGSRAEV